MAKKSPIGASTEGVSSASQYIRSTSGRYWGRSLVMNIWVMQPGPSMSARVAVSPEASLMNGRTFHPFPRWSAEPLCARNGSSGFGSHGHAAPFSPWDSLA